MSAHAESHPLPSQPHHGNANEHPPPIHYSSRINPVIVGIFLFLGSEVMLFGSFFTVYFFDRVVTSHVHGGSPWPPYLPGTHTQHARSATPAPSSPRASRCTGRRPRPSAETAPACARGWCSRSFSGRRSFSPR